MNGWDPTGLDYEPYDPDPVPATASLKGIRAHEVFSDYVLRNHGIVNAGKTLATVLPEHFLPGEPGSNLKPDAVDRSLPTYFELKPITHVSSKFLQDLDYSKQLSYYDTYLPPVEYHRGWSARIVPNVSGGAFIGEFTIGDDAFAVYAYPEMRSQLDQSQHPGDGLIYYRLQEIDQEREREPDRKNPRPPFFLFDRIDVGKGDEIRTVRKEFIHSATQYENYYQAARTAVILAGVVGLYYGAGIASRFVISTLMNSLAPIG